MFSNNFTLVSISLTKYIVQSSVGDLSMGRQEAFEIFRRDYSQNSAIEQKKAALKERYVEAKHLGECVNSARQKISKYPIQW